MSKKSHRRRSPNRRRLSQSHRVIMARFGQSLLRTAWRAYAFKETLRKLIPHHHVINKDGSFASKPLPEGG